VGDCQNKTGKYCYQDIHDAITNQVGNYSLSINPELENHFRHSG
jgi:hypothetical protein